MLRVAPALTVALFVGPIAAGLLATALPAFGWLPALGGTALSLDPWRALLDAPGLPRAVGLTLLTGFGATILSLAVVVLFLIAAQDARWFRRVQAALSPFWRRRTRRWPSASPSSSRRRGCSCGWSRPGRRDGRGRPTSRR
ncbi:hypothetical protein ACE7GA_09025 [Roseomonas sp. CCTCC AB2023176]|uniref:hypothetical protein n=1 Tax=Roseomonas sp. CCTCC AB2023176 TaxID=3342640 RepID=UPI0035E07873